MGGARLLRVPMETISLATARGEKGCLSYTPEGRLTLVIKPGQTQTNGIIPTQTEVTSCGGYIGHI